MKLKVHTGAYNKPPPREALQGGPKMSLTRLAAALLFAPVIIATQAPANAQTVGIVTTPAGSYSHSAGSALAKVLNEKAKLRAVVQAQASTGFEEVESGGADFNVSNSFDATFFATGTGHYSGQGKQPNIRQIATLIPYRVALHVRADSPIKSIADLKGKNVSSGFNAQKTIATIIEAHLANAGLTYKDVNAVATPNVVRAAEDFTSGKVDVLFFALGSGAVKQAAASVGGLRVLPIDTSPEAVKRMQAILPGSYVMNVKPAPALDGVKEPTNIIAFDMVMNTNAKTPEQVVYRTVKAIHDSKAELASTFPPFRLFEPKKMAEPTQGLQFHPGAVKYYKEIGLMK